MNRKALLREFLLMTLGTALVAIGTYFFKFPNHFSTGGITGLAVLLAQLVPSFTPSTYAAVINLLFLVIGFFALDRSFGVRTVYCSILFSGLLQGLEWLAPVTAPLTSSPLLELFFSVIFPALGSAILFNLGSSTGGTDIAALILKQYSSLDTGMALLCSDVLIAASALLVFGIETGLYSLLGLLLKSVMVDSVIESLNRKKSFFVITQTPQITCDYITYTLHRGATTWEAQGAYTHHKSTVILAALSRGQAVALRRHLHLHDPHAFIVIANSSEIFGKGFLRA